MDFYIAAVPRTVKPRVGQHLMRPAVEPEPPFHAVARGRDSATLCGEPVGDSLQAFPDAFYDDRPSFARCPRCEATAR